MPDPTEMKEIGMNVTMQLLTCGECGVPFGVTKQIVASLSPPTVGVDGSD